MIANTFKESPQLKVQIPEYDANDTPLEVEFEVLPAIIQDAREARIQKALQTVEGKIDQNQIGIDKLNQEIDKLTNHADGLDYAVAVASGVLTGLIDSFFVGKIDLKECHEYGNRKIEDKVKKLGKNDDIEKAIKNLEEKTKKFFPSDSNLNDFGGGRQHHLRDFAHHPTPVGLVCSLLTQFTEQCYGTNTSGAFLVVPVKDKSRIGDTLPKKIIYGTLYWFIHLVSDVAGSSGHAGGGTGLPGPILSLAKELSALPFFKKINKKGDKELSVFISKIFNGTLFAEKDASGKIIKESVIPIDLRTEIGILHKQALPIIINECIVRAFYSIRRFGMELKEHPVSEFKDLKQLNWKAILPFGNRTVERMMTIASSTFTAVDIADAAIRSGGFNATCLLRVNFVGIGRCVIAIGTDVGMGIKKHNKENERMKLMIEQLMLHGSVVFYKEANMWIKAESAGEAIEKSYQTMQVSIQYYKESLEEIADNMAIIGCDINRLRNSNEDLYSILINQLIQQNEALETLSEHFESNGQHLTTNMDALKQILKK